MHAYGFQISSFVASAVAALVGQLVVFSSPSSEGLTTQCCHQGWPHVGWRGGFCGTVFLKYMRAQFRAGPQPLEKGDLDFFPMLFSWPEVALMGSASFPIVGGSSVVYGQPAAGQIPPHQSYFRLGSCGGQLSMASWFCWRSLKSLTDLARITPLANFWVGNKAVEHPRIACEVQRRDINGHLLQGAFAGLTHCFF